jgi:hypothetical protein
MNYTTYLLKDSSLNGKMIYVCLEFEWAFYTWAQRRYGGQETLRSSVLFGEFIC